MNQKKENVILSQFCMGTKLLSDVGVCAALFRRKIWTKGGWYFQPKVGNCIIVASMHFGRFFIGGGEGSGLADVLNEGSFLLGSKCVQGGRWSKKADFLRTS